MSETETINPLQVLDYTKNYTTKIPENGFINENCLQIQCIGLTDKEKINVWVKNSNDAIATEYEKVDSIIGNTFYLNIDGDIYPNVLVEYDIQGHGINETVEHYVLYEESKLELQQDSAIENELESFYVELNGEKYYAVNSKIIIPTKPQIKNNQVVVAKKYYVYQPTATDTRIQIIQIEHSNSTSQRLFRYHIEYENFIKGKIYERKLGEVIIYEPIKIFDFGTVELSSEEHQIQFLPNVATITEKYKYGMFTYPTDEENVFEWYSSKTLTSDVEIKDIVNLNNPKDEQSQDAAQDEDDNQNEGNIGLTLDPNIKLFFYLNENNTDSIREFDLTFTIKNYEIDNPKDEQSQDTAQDEDDNQNEGNAQDEDEVNITNPKVKYQEIAKVKLIQKSIPNKDVVINSFIIKNDTSKDYDSIFPIEVKYSTFYKDDMFLSVLDKFNENPITQSTQIGKGIDSINFNLESVNYTPTSHHESYECGNIFKIEENDTLVENTNNIEVTYNKIEVVDGNNLTIQNNTYSYDEILNDYSNHPSLFYNKEGYIYIKPFNKELNFYVNHCYVSVVNYTPNDDYYNVIDTFNNDNNVEYFKELNSSGLIYFIPYITEKNIDINIENFEINDIQDGNNNIVFNSNTDTSLRIDTAPIYSLTNGIDFYYLKEDGDLQSSNVSFNDNNIKYTPFIGNVYRASDVCFFIKNRDETYTKLESYATTVSHKCNISQQNEKYSVTINGKPFPIEPTIENEEIVKWNFNGIEYDYNKEYITLENIYTYLNWESIESDWESNDILPQLEYSKLLLKGEDITVVICGKSLLDSDEITPNETNILKTFTINISNSEEELYAYRVKREDVIIA